MYSIVFICSLTWRWKNHQNRSPVVFFRTSKTNRSRRCPSDLHTLVGVSQPGFFFPCSSTEVPLDVRHARAISLGNCRLQLLELRFQSTFQLLRSRSRCCDSVTLVMQWCIENIREIKWIIQKCINDIVWLVAVNDIVTKLYDQLLSDVNHESKNGSLHVLGVKI